MFLRNEQEFDIYQLQVIGENQYPVGWFFDVQRRTDFNIIEIPDPVKPIINATQKVTQNGFEQINGVWQAKWIVSEQTEEELADTAAQLAAVKMQKNEYINSERDKANMTTFPFNGKFIAVDDLSMRDILSTSIHISLFNAFPTNFPGGWKYTDGSIIAMPTIADFKVMFAAMTAQGTANFSHAQSLKATLEVATTIEEVNSIVW